MTSVTLQSCSHSHKAEDALFSIPPSVLIAHPIIAEPKAGGGVRVQTDGYETAIASTVFPSPTVRQTSGLHAVSQSAYQEKSRIIFDTIYC